MDNQKRGRSSNIELLRILAMMMIITYHIYCHCITDQLASADSPFNNPAFYKKLLLLATIAPWGQIGNAIFIIISGYFLINKGKNINLTKSAFKLLTQLAFASIALMFGTTFIHILRLTKAIEMYGINLFNGMSWYIGYYFVVTVVAYLFLNVFLVKLDRKKYITFLVSMLAILQFSWSAGLLEGIIGGGKTLCTGIFLYSLGAYLQLYKPLKRIRTWAIILIIPVVYALIYLSAYNADTSSIVGYIQSGSTDPYIHNIPGYDNASIYVFILALALFELFCRIDIRKNGIINFLGAGTLMVYLLHDNSLFYTIWKTQAWTVLLFNSPDRFVVKIVLWTFMTFGAGILLYALYLLLCRICSRCKNIVLKEPE